MKHVVFFSGGACSYCAAKRVVERYGVSETRLLFTDTKIEDEDCYRFIDEAAQKLGVELIKIADGRTPFEVYKDKGFLGNNRIAPCSHILKQKTARDYIFSHYEPQNTVLYLGFAHNNCGGFCCRAGQGHFAKLYEHFPERFAYAEQVEEDMRQALGKDISYMKRSVNGITRPYTLKQLRSDIEAHREIDLFDIGGCGCFVDGG